MKRLLNWAAAVAAVAMIGVPALACAQSTGYPNKPIRIIVPYPAGGAVDTVTRIVSTKLGGLLGQPMVVDNRPGGGTLLGTTLAARAAPDGYTLTMGSLASHSTGPLLIKDPPYDPVKDFAPVSLVAVAPIILVVNNDFPANNAAEFLALVRKNPGKYNYGSSGNGSPPHIAGAIYVSLTGTQMVHVPYKGGTAHHLDLQAGRIDAIFDSAVSSMAFVKSGKLKALAIAMPKRSVEIPNVQTFGESGLAGYELTTWYGVLAPAGTPSDIVNQLNAALVKVVAMPEVQDKLRALSIDATTNTPAEFEAMIKRELARYGKAIREADIKAD